MPFAIHHCSHVSFYFLNVSTSIFMCLPTHTHTYIRIHTCVHKSMSYALIIVRTYNLVKEVLTPQLWSHTSSFEHNKANFEFNMLNEKLVEDWNFDMHFYYIKLFKWSKWMHDLEVLFTYLFLKNYHFKIFTRVFKICYLKYHIVNKSNLIFLQDCYLK